MIQDMNKEARKKIINSLKSAPGGTASTRPPRPPLHEVSWDRERMIAEFVNNLQAQTVSAFRVGDYEQASEKLAELLKAEGVRKIIVSADSVIERLNLTEWGREHHINILRPQDASSREDFKELVFDRAQAGVTGVDFAIAESGTICLIHNSKQPRLVSLAPIIHVALLPLERLFPIYEDAIESIFAANRDKPSQVTFITGPSMTADIQGVPFKGMHGPKKLFVILIG